MLFILITAWVQVGYAVDEKESYDILDIDNPLEYTNTFVASYDVMGIENIQPVNSDTCDPHDFVLPQPKDLGVVDLLLPKPSQHNNAELTINLEEPGFKKIRILNQLGVNATIRDIFYIADSFSQRSIKRSLVVKGLFTSTLTNGAWQELQITATPDASSSIYPDGTKFFIQYTTDDSDEIKEANFHIKVEYNDDIEFAPRNLVVDKGKQNYLTILNKNPSRPINIRNIEAFETQIGKYNDCSTLRPGENCRVVLMIDPKSDAVARPLYVTYGIGGREIVATSAIIVKADKALLDQLKDFYKTASITGIKEVVKKGIKKPLEHFEKPAYIANNIGTCFVASTAADYSKPYIGEKIFEKPGHDKLTGTGKALGKTGGTMAFELGFGTKSNKSFGYRFMGYSVCNIITDAVVEPLADYFLPQGKSYLPEKSDDDFVAKHRGTVKRAITPGTRAICNIAVRTSDPSMNNIYWEAAEILAGVRDEVLNSRLENDYKAKKFQGYFNVTESEPSDNNFTCGYIDP